MRRGRLRQTRSFDQPFLLALGPNLFLSLLRLLRPVGDLGDRADNLTEPAAGTGADIDITGMTGYGGGKIAGITGKVFNLTVGEQFNILMPPYLHQFR